MTVHRPQLSVVIPARDNHHLTRECLESVAREAHSVSTEILVVDDGSEVPVRQALADFDVEFAILRHDSPRGFSAAVNAGCRASSARLVLLLNNDTELAPDALRELCDAFDREPRLGVAGARLFYPDGAPQWSGGRRPSWMWLFGLASGIPSALASIPAYRALRPAHRGSQEVDWVPGAAMALRREAWLEVGPFDESLGTYAQDLDLCLRAKAEGWLVRSVEGCRVHHHHGATITRTESDCVTGKQPAQMWTSLLAWSQKHEGRSRFLRAQSALRWGAHLRLLGRALRRPFLETAGRASFDEESHAYRSALRAVKEHDPRVTRPGRQHAPPSLP